MIGETHATRKGPVTWSRRRAPKPGKRDLQVRGVMDPGRPGTLKCRPSATTPHPGGHSPYVFLDATYCQGPSRSPGASPPTFVVATGSLLSGTGTSRVEVGERCSYGKDLCARSTFKVVSEVFASNVWGGNAVGIRPRGGYPPDS